MITPKMLSAPIEVDIDITNRCNLECYFCRTSKDTTDELTDKELNKLVDGLINLKIAKLVISGGEPLLRKATLDVVEKMSQNNIKVLIRTNLTILPDLTVIRLKNAGIKRIYTSLDGPEKIHDEIRGPNKFNLLAKNIQKLRNNKIKVSANMTVVKTNADYILETIEAAHSIGVSTFAINCFIPVKNETTEFEVSQQKITQIAENIISIKEKYSSMNIVFNIPFLTNDYYNKKPLELQSAFGGCKCGRTKISIMANGDIVGCKMLPSLIEGNVRTDSIKDIWNSPSKLTPFRNLKVLPECKNCNLVQSCRGGCKAYTYSLLQSFEHRDPRCKMVIN